MHGKCNSARVIRTGWIGGFFRALGRLHLCEYYVSGLGGDFQLLPIVYRDYGRRSEKMDSGMEFTWR